MELGEAAKGYRSYAIFIKPKCRANSHESSLHLGWILNIWVKARQGFKPPFDVGRDYKTP